MLRYSKLTIYYCKPPSQPIRPQINYFSLQECFDKSALTFTRVKRVSQHRALFKCTPFKHSSTPKVKLDALPRFPPPWNSANALIRSTNAHWTFNDDGIRTPNLPSCDDGYRSSYGTAALGNIRCFVEWLLQHEKAFPCGPVAHICLVRCNDQKNKYSELETFL